MMKHGAAFLVVAGLTALGLSPVRAADPDTMNRVADAYVRLVLAVGQHDPDYVDAFYGPGEWRTEAEARRRPLEELAAEADRLVRDLGRPQPGAQELFRLRHDYLVRQLQAVAAKVRMLSGTKLAFDDESRALYDAVDPSRTEAQFSSVLERLEKVLPGPGSLVDRYDAFKSGFIIPKDRLDAVFRAAITGCRDRTLAHLTLPPEERFTLEYVTGKSWSGYNWYQGGYRSLIQVNTDLPIYIDRAIDLACHEGYPGHHVYNVLLERHLVRGRGWVEFSVYPLFSPQSLIAEGTANFGIDVAFPAGERVAWEKATLFPLAGLDPATADRYYEVHRLVEELGYAGNEAARRYLNGQIDGTQAADWLARFALMPRPRAEQRVRFFDQYRSYVINYNLGKDMVRAYVEKQGGTPDRPAERWKIFARLLSSPRLPSGLR